MQTIKPDGGITLLVCVNRRSSGVACGNRGGEAIASALERELKERGLEVPIERIRCLGECAQGPNARIAPGGEMFHQLRVDGLTQVVEAVEQAVRAATREAG